MEDVADNMVSSQLARGEKESMVIRALCETLSKTGSSSEIVATTMMSALKRVLSETKSDCDIMKAIGNTMHEQGTESEYIFTYTMQSFRKELRKYFILAGVIHSTQNIYHKNPVFRDPEPHLVGNYDNDVLIFCADHHQKWISWS